MQLYGVFSLGFYGCLMNVLLNSVFMVADNYLICHPNSTLLDAGVGGRVCCILFSVCVFIWFQFVFLFGFSLCDVKII